MASQRLSTTFVGRRRELIIITGHNYRSVRKAKRVGLVAHCHMFPNFIDTC